LRQYHQFLGAKLIGIDLLKAGATPREVVEWHLANAEALGKHYFYTDQFNNPNSVVAHETETGPEIVAQLAAWPEVRELVFVSCAGTGATLMGVARSLQASGYAVRVILVEPQGCDSRAGVFVEHRLEGMSVGVSPPFVGWSIVSEARRVSYDDVVECQREFSRSHGHFVGNTAAAYLRVGMQVSEGEAKKKTLVLLYDHGLWYFNPIPRI
jgi:cysteine synthase